MIRTIFIFSVICLFCFNSKAQNDSFNRTVSYLKNINDFEIIEDSLSTYKRDTVSMRKISHASYSHLIRGFGLNALGVYYRNNSQYKKALDLNSEALKIGEEQKNDLLILTSLNNMGVSYRRLDQVRLALEVHKEALMLAEKIQPKSNYVLRSTAVALNSIGNIYLVLKQYELAEIQFTKSLAIEEKVENKLGLAINYQNLGIINEARGQLDQAFINYSKSLKYNFEINSKLGEVICKNSIGQILVKQNKPEKALTYILPTIQLAEELGDKYYITFAKSNAGWAYTKLKKYAEAERYLNESLMMSLKNKFKSSAAETYKHLSGLYEAQGDFQKAVNNLKLRQEYNEQILNEENLKYTAELIVKYDNDKKENQIALLEKENEIVKIKLNQNQRVLIFGAVLVGLLAGILFIWYRQYQLKNEKKLLMLEQQMMRSQMNPHFLFNSLNSIKLYIINNDKQQAVYYLNKFSKFIRTILSNSQEKEISLQEELETMELYMNIENMRFEEKINYKVTVDTNIILEDIKIPSLLLQPFLENAIWHGLSNKDIDRNLSMDIFKEEVDMLIIQITDDGIGRKKAQEIKDTKISKEKSIGVNLTLERLVNFSKNFKRSAGLIYEDLFDSRGIPIGTRVRINIPLKIKKENLFVGSPS